jgi:cold shock protein
VQQGAVARFDPDEGWGVLAADETPGGCWFHFGAVQDSFGVSAGQVVWFESAAVQQDGYEYVATAVWTKWENVGTNREVAEDSRAYGSELRITYD